MLKANRYRLLKIVGLLTIIGVLVWLGTLVDPVALIEKVGPRYAYLVLFGISLFAGTSTFTAVPFYASIVVAITGGLNPLIVALLATPGIVIGDMLFLSLVTNAAELLAQKAAWLRRFDAWFSRQPRWIIYILTYLYFGFVPVSSDVFLTFLALAEVKPREIVPYVVVGNLTFFLWLGYLVQSGSPLLERLIG